LLFAFALLVSIALHVLITFSVYLPDNIITMPLTGGMFFGWLYSSAVLKDISATQKNFSFKSLISYIHPLLKYSLILLAVYAFFTFFNTFSAQSNDSWLDFNLDYSRLRGISAFWLLFYMVGLAGSILKIKFSEEH
jgi:hypothetical protein